MCCLGMINPAQFVTGKDETYGGMGGEQPPSNLENLPIRVAETVVQCVSAGTKTIGELLLLKKVLSLKPYSW